MYFQCPGRYIVGTLSTSLQCICSVPAWYTTLCPQCQRVRCAQRVSPRHGAFQRQREGGQGGRGRYYHSRYCPRAVIHRHQWFLHSIGHSRRSHFKTPFVAMRSVRLYVLHPIVFRSAPTCRGLSGSRFWGRPHRMFSCFSIRSFVIQFGAPFCRLHVSLGGTTGGGTSVPSTVLCPRLPCHF